MKINFFLWRLWNFKILVDDVLQRCINLVSRCRCCVTSQVETVHHLFVSRSFTSRVWQHYAMSVGVQGPFIQCHQTLSKWWSTSFGERIKPIAQAIPAFICWQLWKRRNKINHSGSMSMYRVFNEIDIDLHNLTLVKYLWLQKVPNRSPLIVDFLQRYKQKVYTEIVKWKKPAQRWYKCNFDSTSKGNPGASSIAF